MTHSLKIFAMVGLVVVCCAVAQAQDARPGWVARYLENPPAQWDGWRNSLAPKGEPAPPLTLATEGETDYVIVIPEDATRPETRAADELQLWLGETTGAEFPIVPDTTPARERELSVGRTNRVTEAAREEEAQAGEEGYAIVIDGERVLLLGAGLMGPMPAAFALLEEDLGVRWYAPAERSSWHIISEELNARRWPRGEARVPHSPTLEARLVPRSFRPAVPLRTLQWQVSYNVWGLRNRLNGGWATGYGQRQYAGGGFTVHTFYQLVPPDKHFETNPEYFSLVRDRRLGENAQLCLSNPEVAEVAAATAIEVMRRSAPGLHKVDISPMDWLNDCECDDCRAIEEETGSYSGLLLTFVNRVAEVVEREVPDGTITTLAYWQSRQPPATDMRVRGNVAVRFCLDRGSSFDWPYHSYYDDKMGDPAAMRGWATLPERDLYARWQEISPRMHLWMYPSQYRNSYAPMPSIRAVAENIRYFAEQEAESIYIQFGGSDLARVDLRTWVLSKLLWDPSLDVDELMQDFIWGAYGAAAPAVAEYHTLLWDHCARHTDFDRRRDWIYPVHDEGMFRHGFLEQAREILDRGLAAAEDDTTRRRVELLKLGVVYVESVQLYMQMRDGTEPPEVTRYAAVARELADLCERLEIGSVGFYDGSRTISPTAEWLAAMREVWARRFDQRFLSPEAWGEWAFRTDPENRGVEEGWQAVEFDADAWRPIEVPAFWAQTWAGDYLGYGWYRTTFTLPEAHAGRPVELQFDGVDEQGWVYVNGEYAGEHTLESEFMVGQEVTVTDLWNRPFTITVPPELLRTGENTLVVRVHASMFNGGIHQPVRAHLADPEYRDLSDGAFLHETFEGVPAGDLPAGWRRHIQERDGRVFGRAEVSRHFVRMPTLHLQDQRSHVAVWSESDEVLPAEKQWAVQFDFRLTGALIYKASDSGAYRAANAGAVFGLKRGDYRAEEFFPLVELDNEETAGKPVTLLGLGEVLATDLAANEWHRLVIHREGATWRFYLNDELRATVTDRDTDLRGIAFGSFRDWHHVAQDIHYANIKIGNFVGPEADG